MELTGPQQEGQLPWVPPSPTAIVTPPPSPTEPVTLPPSPPAKPVTSPSAPTEAATPPTPPPQARKSEQILPWVPKLGRPLTLQLPPYQEQQLQLFWEKQKWDTQHMTNLSKHELPLARVKRMMKSNAPLLMVGGDVPALFSKACEMFISELTLRGWFNAEKHLRRTLKPIDVAKATHYTDAFDFLVDVLPWDRDLEVKLALANSVPTIGGGTSIYYDNKCSGTNNVIGGYRMGVPLRNPTMYQGMTGNMVGSYSSSAGTGPGIGMEMRHYYMPPASINLGQLMKQGEASCSGTNSYVPHYARYRALAELPGPIEDVDEQNN